MKKISISLAALLIFYISSLLLMYSLPDYKLQENIESAELTLKSEGIYPVFFLGFKDQTRLDNYTDVIIMVARAKQQEGPLLNSIMDMEDYARYWHGYQILLKPVLSFFTYDQVRIIYGVVVFVLIALCALLLWQKISASISIAFVISMCFVHIEIFYMSMQFSNIFIITFISIIYYLTRKDYEQFVNQKGYIFFFIIGSFVNFIDLLTVPIISLGLLSIIIILSTNNTLLHNMKILIKVSFAWGVGYALTWISKWIISSLILQENIVYNAIQQMFFRIQGNEQYPLDRIGSIAINFETMFSNNNIGYFLGLLLLVLLFSYKKINAHKLLPLIVIAIMPYVWYLILSNHSGIHYWFTYRAQSVTLFSVLSICIIVISDVRKKL